MHRAWMRSLMALLAATTALSIFVPAPATAFRVRARHAGVLDPATGEWLYTQSIDAPVPIASLTKLVTALTFRRLNGDLDAPVTITRRDWVGAGRTRLRVGDVLPARTLLKLALVCSDNCAARALTHAFAVSPETFGFRMQETAWGLGCRNSRFVEPTGLDPRNRSTVREVACLFAAAYEDPVLREFLGTRDFRLDTARGSRIIVHSSRLFRARSDVVAAKTGYLSVAGYCLAERVRRGGREYITVVLGAPTRGARNRESARLIDRVIVPRAAQADAGLGRDGRQARAAMPAR